ncbi:serine hydrolase [Phyllobacterium sp. SYP-B3895]|uniref:serine hydrolase n=1 Tax=Phyllobacterium sp. SYP-B3895 TaxID=2663240 RepID=UPI0012997A8B|nr:serine hydrolase [Phyllobacterium sp. SYP-B3895]
MTARDAARFGQLFLDYGKWNGKQIVPKDWIDVSTRGLSRTNRGDRGYGYMWWQLSSGPWGKDGAYTAGFAGQFIAFVPSKRLVIAQIVERKENKQGTRTRDFLGFVKDLTVTAP